MHDISVFNKNVNAFNAQNCTQKWLKLHYLTLTLKKLLMISGHAWFCLKPVWVPPLFCHSNFLSPDFQESSALTQPLWFQVLERQLSNVELTGRAGSEVNRHFSRMLGRVQKSFRKRQRLAHLWNCELDWWSVGFLPWKSPYSVFRLRNYTRTCQA